MLDLIPFILAGIIAGTFTGLIPGLHINLVSATLLSATFISRLSPTSAVTFIVSMAITHTFLDFIPSIYLGAPEEDTALSVLPGHELLMEGHGHQAVILTLIGSVIAIISLTILIPTFIFFAPKFYPFLEKMMAFVLIWTAIFLLYDEKKSRIQSFIIFILAGFLGIASLNLNLKEPLLPLLSGLFGSSTLIYSIKVKSKVPKQNLEKEPLPKKELILPTITTILVSPICSLLPGLGSSQAAIIGKSISRSLSRKQFLILLGSINTLVMAISFVALFLLSKSRTGAAVAVSQLITITPPDLTRIIIIMILASLISIPLTIQISKVFAKNIHKIEYSKLSVVVLIALTIGIFAVSGFVGLLVFAVSTSLGLSCVESGVRKGFLMGCLLVPTIIYYLPF